LVGPEGFEPSTNGL